MVYTDPDLWYLRHDDIFHDPDKGPKHVEMFRTKCQPKIGTDKMPTTEKSPDKMPTFGWHFVRLAFCPTTVEIKVPVLFRRYIEVHGRPSPVTFLPATPRHPHQMLLRFVKCVLSFSTTSGYKIPQTKPDLFVDAKPTSFVLKRPSSNIYIGSRLPHPFGCNSFFLEGSHHQFTFV